MIHVALVSAYPDEMAARAAFDQPPVSEYRGTWKTPEPFTGVVHLFTDADLADFVTLGWEKVE